MVGQQNRALVDSEQRRMEAVCSTSSKRNLEGHEERRVGALSREENPADIGSRGERALKLKESELWWKGPAWLCKQESEWPKSEISQTTQSNEEIKKLNVTVAGVTKQQVLRVYWM